MHSLPEQWTCVGVFDTFQTSPREFGVNLPRSFQGSKCLPPAITAWGTDLSPQLSHAMHLAWRWTQTHSPLSLAPYSFACGLLFPVSTSSIQSGHALHRWSRPLSQGTPARTCELWLCQCWLGETAKSPHGSHGNPIRDVFLYCSVFVYYNGFKGFSKTDLTIKVLFSKKFTWMGKCKLVPSAYYPLCITNHWNEKITVLRELSDKEDFLMPLT